jgi:DNA-binding GntR family transcriptional regulator
VANLAEPRLSLGEAAYRRVRGDIISCRLGPGQRVTERQLAADLGFGIAPVREALTRLSHEGLVHTLPRKGYQIAPLTPKSIDDLFVVWEIVGPELVRMGIRQATQEQIAAARTAFEELDGLAGEEGRSDTVMRDIEVVNATFEVLAEATGNEYLVTLFGRLMGDMSRIRALLLTADSTATLAGPAEHWIRHILDERDPDAAAATARCHIQEVHRRVLEAVVRWPSVMRSEVVVPLTR